MNSLPYCYFPTKVVCIDDDEDTLKTLDLNVKKNEATYLYFDDPRQALEFLNNKNKPSVLFNRLLAGKMYPFTADSIYHLYEEIYNSQRYDAVSCILVDQVMPQMKGLELCQKIEDKNIKKILLTGIAEEELAIEAFNNGIIDFYIRKHDPKAYDRIVEFIDKSQISYFKTLANTHIDTILKDWVSFDPEASALFDPAFTDFFNSFIKEHKINEYYLLDLMGSFLYLTAAGKIGALFIHNEETLEENDNVTEDFLESSPSLAKEIIRDLKQHRKILCFPFISGLNTENYNWNKCIYPLQTLEGQRHYYIAHATEIDYIEQDKILTFNQYKKSIIT